MKFEEKKVSEEEWKKLTRNVEFPASSKQAEDAGYSPLEETQGLVEAEAIKTLYLNPSHKPGGAGPCGTILDKNGHPVPVYPDPNTGTCTMPYVKFP